MCCEFSEKNFWLSVAAFAVVWGISVQYPFIVESTVELPDVIYTDAFAKVSDVEAWPSWCTVYDVNVTKGVDTNSVS